MSKIDFIKNKYSISVLILLVCMGVDILLHRGMSRVMLPASFTQRITPYLLKPFHREIRITEKAWDKAINSTEAVSRLDTKTPGFECDVYFDTSKHTFYVYHDSLRISHTTMDEILHAYKKQGLTASLWLDMKNLSNVNCAAANKEVDRLRDLFGMSGKMIIESSVPSCLESFYNSGYFTSYYVPFFNPYQEEEHKIISMIDSIAAVLKKYPACALSGYYFQYPALKKFFPNYPVLTWADRSWVSIVSLTFNHQLMNDSMVKVILYNK